MAQLSWEAIQDAICDCRRCNLCRARTHIALGEGNTQADIMLVGEGPGEEEDRQGRPFVGKAGQLLDRMMAAIELSREELYITNVVKCRPPNNRTPAEDEANACLPFLRAQYALIQPKIVLCLGATATKYVYDRDAYVSRMHGKWLNKGGVWFLPTYHPAALLRDERKKRDAWADLQALKQKYSEIKRMRHEGA